MKTRFGVVPVAFGVAAFTALVHSQQPRSAAGEWISYGGTNWSQKYSPLDQINGNNFKNLKVAWTWQSPDHDLLKTLPPYPEMPLNANGSKGTPLVVRSVMYMSSGLDQIAAIDPVSGVTKWLYNPEAYKDGASGRCARVAVERRRLLERRQPTSGFSSAHSTAIWWRSMPKPASRSRRLARMAKRI